MDFQQLQRDIAANDILSVEQLLAHESPEAMSRDDLETLIALLADEVEPNVAMEVVRWLEATDLRRCASASVRTLVQGSDSVSFWLRALIHRMANLPAGQVALKDALSELSADDISLAGARHDRLRQLATTLI